jgi:hypothetical protein
MQKDEANGDRPAPNFFIDKKQGLRHLLHSAIRMILDGEDPFAINMLGQAADKVLLDLLKHAKIDDPIEFEDRIVPEHKKEFFRLYRQAFNFLKHADDDPNEKLPVYNLILGNETLLFFNIIRYRRLYSETTTHMQLYISCVALLHPGYIKWQNMGEKGQQFVDSRKAIEHLTRANALDLFRKRCYGNGKFLTERADDLKLVGESNHQRLSGKPGPPRFRIPIND